MTRVLIAVLGEILIALMWVVLVPVWLRARVRGGKP